MQIDNNLKYPYLNLLFLLLPILIQCLGFINLNILNNYYLIILLLWYLEIIIFEKTHKLPKSYVFIIILWWLYEIILKFLDFSSASIGNYLNTLKFFDIIIKTLYVLAYYNEKTKKILFLCIYIVSFFTIVGNLYYFHQYGEIYHEMYAEMKNSGVNESGIEFASTHFYNSLIFLIGISFYCFMQSEKIFIKIFFMFSILISYYFMLSIETRATSLLCSVLLILFIYYKVSKFLRRKIIIIVSCLLLVLFLPLWLPTLVTILPERVSLRLNALLDGNTSNSEYLSRFVLMKISVNTFFDNFVIGVGDHRGREFWNLIGQHSQIFDTLARYGSIGLLFLIYFIKNTYKYIILNLRETRFKSVFLACYLVFILLSFNTSSFNMQVALTAFLLLSTLSMERN